MKKVRSNYAKKQQNLIKKYRDNIRKLNKDKEDTAKNAIRKVTGKSKDSINTFYNNQKKAKGYIRKGILYGAAAEIIKSRNEGKNIVADLLAAYGLGNIAAGTSTAIINYNNFRKSK